MANSTREQDSGKYSNHVGGQGAGEAHPNMSKLDLSKEPTRTVAANFHRGALGIDDGRQRPSAG